jgi:hypothetical protein
MILDFPSAYLPNIFDQSRAVIHHQELIAMDSGLG